MASFLLLCGGCAWLTAKRSHDEQPTTHANPTTTANAGGNVTQLVLNVATARTGGEIAGVLVGLWIWRKYRVWRQATHRTVYSIELENTENVQRVKNLIRRLGTGNGKNCPTNHKKEDAAELAIQQAIRNIKQQL